MLTSLTAVLTNAIDAIVLNGYAILDDFLTPTEIASLATFAQKKWHNGDMVEAKTGKSTRTNQSIRGDYISWLDEHDQEPAINAYFNKMQTLKQMLNAQLFMNLHELETHIARYPVGSIYQKHLDQFSHGNHSELQHRQLSAVLYLNQDWHETFGGELRLYLNENEHLDILPNAGRMVLFLSARFWHEVRPAQRERLSVTGWFRTRSMLLP
ncbi:MAG: 2OG-Fe(II) oxygenase [Methylophilus sp.]|nr:2OG-Fe(II) oxygenase [Methylophilus sp.]